MPALTEFSLLEDLLQFIGVFVSFSIAYISYRGVKQTQSSSLLRLTMAFGLLGIGFLVEGLVGIGSTFAVVTGLATVVVAGLVLETMGYFLLAFSHALDVMLSKRLGFVMMVFPVVAISTAQLTSALSILSFYFVLYGVVETVYSYARTRRPDTLVIALGLSSLGVGTLIQWLSLLYTEVDVLSLLQIIMREVGLLILFIPVLGFARKEGRVRLDGAI